MNLVVNFKLSKSFVTKERLKGVEIGNVKTLNFEKVETDEKYKEYVEFIEEMINSEKIYNDDWSSPIYFKDNSTLCINLNNFGFNPEINYGHFTSDEYSSPDRNFFNYEKVEFDRDDLTLEEILSFLVAKEKSNIIRETILKKEFLEKNEKYKPLKFSSTCALFFGIGFLIVFLTKIFPMPISLKSVLIMMLFGFSVKIYLSLFLTKNLIKKVNSIKE